MAFKYRKDRKTEDVQKWAKQQGGGYDSYVLPDYAMYKAREGENAIRILPRTWDDTQTWGKAWGVPIFVHYNVGADGGTYLCAVKMKQGEACPACEAQRSAADEDEAKELRPNWRCLVWVIDRDNESAGPQWWAMPLKVFREINNRSVDKKTKAVIYIDDPEEGYDITFTREGNDRRTDYTSIDIERESTPLHDEEKKQTRWLNYIEEHPLPDILNFYDEEHIEKVLSGQKSSKRKSAADEDEEEEEAPKTRGRQRRAAAADEEEEEEEAPKTRKRVAAAVDEDEDEEEEEAPPKTRRRAAAVEDDEDDADDDEDEEEAPKTRGRRAAAASNGEDDEDEDEEEAPKTRRRPMKAAQEEDEDEAEEDEEPPSKGRGRVSPSAQAKGKLQRLQARR